MKEGGNLPANVYFISPRRYQVLNYYYYPLIYLFID